LADSPTVESSKKEAEKKKLDQAVPEDTNLIQLETLEHLHFSLAKFQK
jgi:hypothetical protein